ncbi:MAG: sigma-E factor negative regulatory protein [Rhodanobacter sp.]|nr:sigma-E factor negative regulatory protein [Rhodanobacter sp.]
MSQDVLESLSAGMDGELSNEQLRFLLRRLDHDAPLQHAWTRYHIARDGMRQQLPLMASPGFSSRVMLAIKHEVASATTSRRSHWLRWSTGGAIAASVAAAALMLGRPTGDSERTTAATASQSRSVAHAAPVVSPAMPAAVPPWLSGNSAGLLSQQASATFGAPLDQGQSVYATSRLSDYSRLHRYRTLNNNDGSYLLLLDPDQRAVPEASPRASSIPR